MTHYLFLNVLKSLLEIHSRELIKSRHGSEDRKTAGKKPKNRWKKPPKPEENAVDNLVRKYMES